ncbi:unnamed protein product [Urochloa humidicola]
MMIMFELMDVMPVSMIIDSLRFYTHVNFTVRSAKEGSKEQLFKSHGLRNRLALQVFMGCVYSACST